MSATPEGLELIRHALGLTEGRTTPYRNHFAASEGHQDMPTIRRLIANSLMEPGYTNRFGMTLYHVTDTGCALVGTTREVAER